MSSVAVSALSTNNKVRAEDRAAHEWYRFVLSFPPHLVRDCVARFGLTTKQRVLDPFCGTGTTLVECKKLGLASIGIEANPMACFASEVKTEWGIDPDGLLQHASGIADLVRKRLDAQGIGDDEDLPLFGSNGRPQVELRTLSPEASKLLLSNCINPLPLHKTLTLLEAIQQREDNRFAGHERLALAKAVISEVSNLHFGPEVGVRVRRDNPPVVQAWMKCVRAMAEDLRHLGEKAGMRSVVHLADARQTQGILKPCSIDAVITSPPYPNEKDYTRTTRLELVLLGFIQNRHDLRLLKHGLVRSNTRNVFKDDDDDSLVAKHPEIQRIASAIETRRKKLGKTSGFERLYARVTTLYFGGMARHLRELRTALRPGAQLAYVVGDQASFLRVMIRTGQLLADLAESLGYEVAGLELFRTRLATATKEQLREEILLLRWPGTGAPRRVAR